MKGLRKIIFPFAPDQSGAASVFYDLGGMIVICDAGGCAGNICGFDEPRWFGQKSAVFSAGLRDMDAILGRDEQMVQKMADAAHRLDVHFAVVIGTPVPATIATDYRAIKRLAEKRCGIPVMTVDTNGISWYDEGAQKAYMELMRTFARDCSQEDIIPGSVGVLGATPIDFGDMGAADEIRRHLMARGASRAVCYGAGASLDDVRQAGCMEKNLVIAPSGLKAAKYLQKRFGTPYEADYPLPESSLMKGAFEQFRHPEGTEVDLKSDQGRDSGNAIDIAQALSGRKILIIHQQVRANALREKILAKADAEVDVATWFMLKRELKKPQDIAIKEEDQFISLVKDGGYDVIFGDPSFYKAIRRFYKGIYIDFPHFAVSG